MKFASWLIHYLNAFTQWKKSSDIAVFFWSLLLQLSRLLYGKIKNSLNSNVYCWLLGTRDGPNTNKKGIWRFKYAMENKISFNLLPVRVFEVNSILVLFMLRQTNFHLPCVCFCLQII